MHGLGDTERPMASGVGQMGASGHSATGTLGSLIIMEEMKTLLNSSQLVFGMMVLCILMLNMQEDLFVNMIQLLMVSW